MINAVGFAPQSNREEKALKIRKVLKGLVPGKPRLLDIGSGNGEIARHLANEFEVVGLDIVDQRTVKDFPFVQGDAERLPFGDESFDFVITNHVVEHLQDQERHFKEIHRVLKEGGYAYLATPNRLWPIEVHYRVPFLHFLPYPLFKKVLTLSGLFKEDLSLLSYWRLRRQTLDFQATWVSDEICRRPRDFF